MVNDLQIKMRPFSELLERVVDNRGKTCPTSEAGIPLIATNCIRNENLYPSYKKVRYVSQETYRTWFRGHPEPGDIIFVNKGTPGRTCLVPDPIDFCIAQDMVAVRANEEEVDQQYLFAALRSPQVQADIANMHVGTLIPHFKKGDFQRLLIPVPNNANVQKSIGHIYLSFSEKIELNRQMNRTLEKMAQAIFKSWFIDFDPVVWNAVQAGKPVPQRFAETAARYRADQYAGHPGLPKEIVDLFPDSFVESELGLIPEGWGVTSLYNTAVFINGAAFKNEHFCERLKGLPVIKIAELKQGVLPQTKYSDRKVDPKYRINTGDLLYSWSGSPSTSLATFIWTRGRGLLNQHIFKVVTESDAQKQFVYYLLKQLRPTLIAIAQNKQTTGLGHVTVADMKRLLVCKAPGSVLSSFYETVGPIYDLCFSNELESEVLSKKREALIPKLISGELSIPDATIILEELG